MAFVQLIDYRTTEPDEVSRLLDEWIAASKGKRTASRTTVCRDRDDATRYIEILVFPSYEEAMANSNLPETNNIHDRFVELCTEPPTFVNLDVLREEWL
ncbi:hypothetical protein GCM10012275_57200 [Longimycelium tulufanense]|uniref:Uncharacterized protein n=1 Tax=Longimycelium tulufanense TaxID=907463 RepID=A0A8J3CDQ0_9PSEU|nr:hypothetical protein [Longimycelium tulufanense]GGM79160.1 hypothetical protein GCM10012275_57200 [Longimycelium tulufanense]